MYIYICIWAPVKILYISVVVIIGIAFWRGAYLFSVCCVIIAVRGQYRFTTVFRAHLWQTNYNTKVVFNHFDRDSSYCIFYHEIPRHIIHIPLKYVGHYLLCLNLFCTFFRIKSHDPRISSEKCLGALSRRLPRGLATWQDARWIHRGYDSTIMLSWYSNMSQRNQYQTILNY